MKKPKKPSNLRVLLRAGDRLHRYHGPITDHFNGRRFYNPNQVMPPHMGILLRWWMSKRKWIKWPSWINNSPPSAKLQERIKGNEICITFVGQATLLIQTAGLNILTDPVFSHSIGPFKRRGIKRVRDPGIAFENLPPIDIVLISHDHYDHLDIPTIKNLIDYHHPRFFYGLGVDHILNLAHFKVGEPLDWWDSKVVGEHVKIIFVPAQHYSRRGPFDHCATLWGAFVIDTPNGKILFAGDTGYGPHFQKIYERLGAMKISILPIGGYSPHTVMHLIHLNPEEAALAHHDLHSQISIGMHFGTFPLTDEPYEEPAQKLREAMKQQKIASSNFIIPEFGVPLRF